MAVTTAEPAVRAAETTADVVVVGGGIGGLTAALALARSGRSVRVLERSAEFAEVGAGLQLAPNATRELARLGVLDEVVARGVLPRRLVLRDALDGAELTSLDLDEEFRKRYGGVYVVAHRSDLLDVLVEACAAAGVALETGRATVDVRQDGEVAEVVCADGAVHRAGAVVGADGLRSSLRTRLSDDEPVASGYVAYRGTVPFARAGAHVDPADVTVFIGPGLHCVQYALRGGEMANTVAVFRSPGYLANPDDPDWGGPEELDQVFAGTCAAVQEALPLLWRDRRWQMFDRDPIRQWVDGRLALLGDAAHPMLQYLAQGACQSIEDAVALAGALAETRDVPAALDAYAEARRDRTARVQSTARVWGEIWHVDGVARLLRNELLRTLDPAQHGPRYVDWLYGPPQV
ncbi:FAD-dependent oxidoreductase [Geodermatophilus ruber]|uniref:Salicylate hydroxylase n=1 Tax=Geodermatophilus ruber TaxID=504800 RepID=A0A1I4HFE3_9ACTN|nr:FAD-dependent oxidoreductase [Geodermatophilus ruber]SFL40417.1 salicylate hydroxylase [Geodermatophilus ruber]